MKIDVALVERVKAGDQEAFEKLYREIYQDLFKFGCFMMGNEREAEDTVSEAVFLIWKQIKKLREPEKFKSWSFTILANCCKKQERDSAGSGGGTGRGISWKRVER